MSSSRRPSKPEVKKSKSKNEKDKEHKKLKERSNSKILNKEKETDEKTGDSPFPGIKFHSDPLTPKAAPKEKDHPEEPAIPFPGIKLHQDTADASVSPNITSTPLKKTSNFRATTLGYGAAHARSATPDVQSVLAQMAMNATKEKKLRRADTPMASQSEIIMSKDDSTFTAKTHKRRVSLGVITDTPTDFGSNADNTSNHIANNSVNKTDSASTTNSNTLSVSEHKEKETRKSRKSRHSKNASTGEVPAQDLHALSVSIPSVTENEEEKEDQLLQCSAERPLRLEKTKKQMFRVGGSATPTGVVAAKASFDASDDAELTIREGQTVIITERDESGWVYGGTEIGSGWFPCWVVDGFPAKETKAKKNIESSAPTTPTGVASPPELSFPPPVFLLDQKNTNTTTTTTTNNNNNNNNNGNQSLTPANSKPNASSRYSSLVFSNVPAVPTESTRSEGSVVLRNSVRIPDSGRRRQKIEISNILNENTDLSHVPLQRRVKLQELEKRMSQHYAQNVLTDMLNKRTSGQHQQPLKENAAPVVETGDESEEESEPFPPAEPKGEVEQNLKPDSAFQTGIDICNAKSIAKGIAYLKEKELIENSPIAVAQFLHSCTTLDKALVGEFLSDNGNQEILSAFLEELDFSSLEFDTALRRFLYSFRLPGEAQKIDRLMEGFANKYYSQYEGQLFANQDAVYILAFSTIMLNTDIHNKSIKKKMTQEQFISNNRGINDGQDLQRSFLEDLYQRIRDDEIQTKANVLFPEAFKRGWLLVETKKGFSKQWKKKWFILDKTGFYAIKNSTAQEPDHSYTLKSTTLALEVPAKDKSMFPFLVKTSDGDLHLAAMTQGHMESWIVAFTTYSKREEKDSKL